MYKYAFSLSKELKYLPPKLGPKKTLVLDLDETLVRAMNKPG